MEPRTVIGDFCGIESGKGLLSDERKCLSSGSNNLFAPRLDLIFATSGRIRCPMVWLARFRRGCPAAGRGRGLTGILPVRPCATARKC